MPLRPAWGPGYNLPRMPLLTSILLLLVVSRLFGEIMNRVGQPALVGEILAGVVLGPSVLGAVAPTDHLAGIAELSVFLIVLSAGLEMELADVMRAFAGKGLIIAVTGFVVPLLSGVLLGLAFGFDALRTIFLGLCMAITALPVAVRILESFDMLDSSIARYSIATAVLNDVAALLLLGVLLDRPISGGLLLVALSILKTSGKLVLFGLFIALASRALKWGSGEARPIERVFHLPYARFHWFARIWSARALRLAKTSSRSRQQEKATGTFMRYWDRVHRQDIGISFEEWRQRSRGVGKSRCPQNGKMFT